MEGFVTTSQLMKKYSVTRQAIYHWKLVGLPSVKLDGRTVIFNEYEVHQWLLKNMNHRKNRGVIK